MASAEVVPIVADTAAVVVVEPVAEESVQIQIVLDSCAVLAVDLVVAVQNVVVLAANCVELAD